jgi:hypothetical protein
MCDGEKMTELKTTKEIFEKHGFESGIHGSLISLDLLREEAIKWIKQLEKQQDINDREGSSKLNDKLTQFAYGEDVRMVGMIYEFEPSMNWIKHFFNITDRDLK